MILNDAVNICLRYIGEAPVPAGVDIDSLDPLHEAYQARDMLEEMSGDLQSTGWWFNRESWTFQPDINKRIGVPSNVLSLTADDDVVNRGGSLYNRADQSFEFDAEVSATVIFKWDFETLPTVFAKWVTYETARDLQDFLRGDNTVDAKLEQQAFKAKLRVDREHLAQSNFNLISGTRLVDRTSIPSPVT